MFFLRKWLLVEWVMHSSLTSLLPELTLVRTQIVRKSQEKSRERDRSGSITDADSCEDAQNEDREEQEQGQQE